MKARLIRPNFWTDEKVVQLTPLARLLFIGLWQLADDEGRLEWSPVRVKLQLFPADQFDILPLCAELRQFALICAYTVEGRDYIEVTNFSKHQKFDARRKSSYPAPVCAGLRQSPALSSPSPHPIPDLTQPIQTLTLAAPPPSNPPAGQSVERFIPPTIDECKTYAIECGMTAERGSDFFMFYESKGWMVGKTKMKKWRMAMAGTWKKGSATSPPPPPLNELERAAQEATKRPWKQFTPEQLARLDALGDKVAR